MNVLKKNIQQIKQKKNKTKKLNKIPYESHKQNRDIHMYIYVFHYFLYMYIV